MIDDDFSMRLPIFMGQNIVQNPQDLHQDWTYVITNGPEKIGSARIRQDVSSPWNMDYSKKKNRKVSQPSIFQTANG